MHNTLILGHFFAFLKEMDLLTPYLKILVVSAANYSHFPEALFFKCEPSDWIAGAFTWETQTSVNWGSVNDLWLARLNDLENKKSFK